MSYIIMYRNPDSTYLGTVMEGEEIEEFDTEAEAEDYAMELATCHTVEYEIVEVSI